MNRMSRSGSVAAWGLVTAVAAGWAAVAVSSVSAAAAAGAKPPAATKPAPPKTHKVARGPLRIDVKLSGAFEARRKAELSLSPDVWTQLRVLEAVEHGSPVEKGDVLLQLDLKKVDEAVAKRQRGLELGELTLRQGAEELRHQEQTTPEQLAAVVRARKRANEDLERFDKIGRPKAVKAAAYQVKYRTDVLEYTREELRQLKKMYEADDLTEDTEEIVLKRQHDAVGRAIHHFENAKLDQQRQLEVVLPRQAEDLTSARKSADENCKSQQTLLPLTLKKKQLEAAKAQRDHARARRDLERIKADREAMTVRAPMDGLVFYGRCVRGQWTTAKTVAAKLVRGGAIAADEVFMTVVDPKELLVHATVPEKELHRLRKGLSGRATPTGYPRKRLQVQLDSVLPIPASPAGFGARLTVVGKAGGITPGMTCSVRLRAYEKKDALTVPAAAVHAEDDEPDKRYVRVKTAKGSEKRPVKVGREHAGKIEILDGLAAGETVLLGGAR